MNGKILIFEDDLGIHELYITHLELNNYQVKCVHTCKEGEQAILDFKPDLIILDVMMPDLDGVSFFHQFKEKAKFANIPVVMITSLEKKLIENYPSDVPLLKKPFTHDSLLAQINPHFLKRS